MKTVYLSSGNVQLDSLLGGGLIRSGIYLVLGQSGTGKTRLGLQFISPNKKVRTKNIFISFRETSQPEELFFLIHKKNDKTYTKFETIPIRKQSAKLLRGHLIQLIRSIRPERLVLDDMHLLSAYPCLVSLRSLAELINLCRNYAGVTLLTATENSEGINHPLVDLADGVILLRYHTQNDQILRKIMVLKHRGVSHELVGKSYTISTTGIVIADRPSVTEKPVMFVRETVHQPEKSIVVIPEMLYFDAEEERMVTRRIAEYNAQHPEMPVQILDRKIESVYDYNLLIEKFEKGETPCSLLPIDLYRLPQFAEQGLIHPLDRFFTPSVRELYLDVALQQCMYKGVIYAIPQYVNVGILVYRKDLLEKYHCQPPKTWKELVATAQLILENEADPTLYGFGFQGSQFENLSCNFLEFLWCNGGDVFDVSGKVIINSEAAIEALTFMTDLIYKYKLAPPDTPYLAESQTERLFLNRHLIYLRSWPRILSQANWTSSQVQNKVGFVPLPVGPRGKYSIPIIGEHGYIIPKQVQEPEKIWRFITEFLSPDAVVDFAIKGWTCPARKSAYTNSDVLLHRPYYSQMLELLPTGRARQQIPHYPVVTQLIKREVHLCLRREKSPKDALNTIAEELHKTIHRHMHTPPITRAIEYITLHLHEPLQRDTVANIVHVSPSHFSVLFKEVTGQTFTEYLTHTRIEHAKRLLGNPEYNIEQIAEKVGFNDESYFTMVFKKLTGVTPSRYRLNLQGMIASL
ncbi:MAG: extracellular solute-binding protein [bacterium]|nr:extracellular solute-binding protein [bacterium]